MLLKRDAKSRVGSIKNVLVQNVIATGQGTSLIAGFNDNLKENLPSKDLENITLSNVSIRMQAEALADKRAAQGLLMAHVNGLKMNNVNINWDTEPTEPRWTHAIEINDVANAHLSGLNIRQGLFTKDSVAALRLHNVRQATLVQNVAAPGTGIFMRITGSNTRQLEVEARPSGMLLARKYLSMGPEVPTSEIIGRGTPAAAPPTPPAAPALPKR